MATNGGYQMVPAVSSSIIPKNWIPMSGIGQQAAAPAAAPRPKYTPNPYNTAQLAEIGNMQAPQWMIDAYSRKMGKIGNNANPNGGGTQFPVGGGKSAPTGGV